MSILSAQQAIADFLNRQPFLVGAKVEIIPEDKGDIIATLNAKIATLGICAMVSIPSFRATSSASRLIVGDARFTIEVVENPTINRKPAGRATCSQVAEYIAGALNLERLDVGDGDTILPVFTEFSSVALDNTNIITVLQFQVSPMHINPPTDTVAQ